MNTEFRQSMNSILTQAATRDAQRWAEKFAEKHGMGLDKGPSLVLTDEQAVLEYGTPDRDSEPWLFHTLERA